MRLALSLVLILCGPAAGEGIVAAAPAVPTGRYDHGVLGDAVEWAALDVLTDRGRRLRFILPPTRVFEDVLARVADLDGDGQPEVAIVETDLDRGASLAVYGVDGLIAATPFLGRRHRWLAPAAIGDLDGDGRIEIAYIDRPHLRHDLVVVRLQEGRLVPVARMPGLTNHRIGEAVIRGGLRACPDGPVVLLADPTWSHAVAVRLVAGDRLTGTRLSPIATPADLDAATAC